MKKHIFDVNKKMKINYHRLKEKIMFDKIPNFETK
jgi:hypothetical protein